MEISPKIIEDFQLKIDINKWQKSFNDRTKKEEILYEIELYSEISKKKWAVFRSIVEMKDLVCNLSSVCLNVPECKNIEYASEKISNQVRNEIFDNFKGFLKSIQSRGDVINNKYFIDFFSLKNHSDNLINFIPKNKAEIKGISKEVSDIIYLEENSILIVGTAKKVERSTLDKYGFVKKIKFFFSKEKLGAIYIYKLNLNLIVKSSVDKGNCEGNNEGKDDGEIANESAVQLLNTIETDDEIAKMCLADNKRYLIVGYFNGYIEIFDLTNNEGMISTNILTSLFKFDVSDGNNSKIINIGFNSSTNYIYTACYDDNEIGIYFVDSKNKLASVPASEDNLCGFEYYYDSNKIQNFIITYDIKGRLLIGFLNNNSTKFINLYYVLLNQMTEISLFKVDFDHHKIFIGNYDGILDIFSYDENNSETNIDRKKYRLERILQLNLNLDYDQTSKIQNLNNAVNKYIVGKYPFAINDVIYNHRKNEYLISIHNGTIQIFSHFKRFAECVIHDNVKTNYKILLNKSSNLLFIGGADKNVLIYKLPDYYMSEMTRKFQSVNSINIADEKVQCRNAIDKGYEKTTKIFRKKSLADKLITEI